MPTRHVVDAGGGVVHHVFEGEVDDAQLTAHQQRLHCELGLEAAFDHLVDVRGVTRLAVSPEVMWRVAAKSPRGAGFRIAVVVSRGVDFGLSREYAGMAELSEERFRIFRDDMAAARRWLGLDDGGG